MAETYKIVVCGLDNAGKTSIVRLLKDLRPALALITSPSVALEKEVKRSLRYRFVFFVIPGQRRFHTERILSQVMADADCLIFVVDAADRHRLPEARDLLKLALKVYTRVGSGNRLVILAHKQDLSSALDASTIYRELWEPISSEFPQVLADIFETTIFKPSTVLRALREGVILHLLTRDPFDYLVRRVQIATRAELIAIFDGEAFPLSIAGDETTAYEVASLVREFLDRLRLEGRVEGVVCFSRTKLAFVGRKSKGDGEEPIMICAKDFLTPIAQTIRALRQAVVQVMDFLRRRYHAP